MFNSTFWAVTQPLGKNNPIAGFVHILPSAGLYLIQHFLECNNANRFPVRGRFRVRVRLGDKTYNLVSKKIIEVYGMSPQFTETNVCVCTLKNAGLFLGSACWVIFIGLFLIFLPRCWVIFFYLTAGLSLSPVKLLNNAAAESTGFLSPQERAVLRATANLVHSFGEKKVFIHFIYKVFNVV